MERRLAAILAADAVGYSRMMREDERGALALLQKHRSEVIDPALTKHRGRTVKLMGDGLLTIDGDFHRRSRLIMLPAFHRERILVSADTVVAEITRALDDVALGDPVQTERARRETPGCACPFVEAPRRRC